MSQAATKPRPATFAPDPERRSLIAKVHVAKKEMGLLDDDYRAMLIEVTGRSSSADCTVAELRKLVEHMKAKGFQPKKASSAADHPFAKKARAMWISLYHLGAIDNPSEQALEAFARRQLGCMKMQWANQAHGYKVVEALKAIAERNGWDQKVTSTRGMQAGRGRRRAAHPEGPPGRADHGAPGRAPNHSVRVVTRTDG
jgi:phage gp16-like protein